METDPYKKRLEAEGQELETRMRALGRPNPAVSGDWELARAEITAEADPVDEAQLITGRENDAAILNDLETRYDLVREALKRIEKGTYGVCRIGGEPIEHDRLMADPAATTCKAHLNA